MEKKSAIGLVGLGVMGQNLARNIASKGYQVSVYNRHPEVTSAFVEQYPDPNIKGCFTLDEFVNTLERPRVVFLMIKAGTPVDDFINLIYPKLDYQDLIVDGGNSNYLDTERRCLYLESKARLFIGCGVSGGEEGALHGPSMMPGGMKQGWPLVRDLFMDIAAKADDGIPCCEWIGSGGAGHFVKMVHNGIEYGDMQLIAESYGVMRDLFGKSNDEIASIFARWNSKQLSSYLIEITSKVLSMQQDGAYVIDQILDVAGQKGTGKWSVETASELGVTLSVIAEAVNQRNLSGELSLRERMAKVYPFEGQTYKTDENDLDAMEKALFASKIISYEQGFALMHKASLHYDWDLKLDQIASIWRAGCIIRSSFLDDITKSYQQNSDLESILFNSFFIGAIQESLNDWIRVVHAAIEHGYAMPAHSAALNYFYAMRTKRLPTNLIQGQRDFFGAHTYERVDKPRGEFYHTKWEE